MYRGNIEVLKSKATDTLAMILQDAGYTDFEVVMDGRYFKVKCDEWGYRNLVDEWKNQKSEMSHLDFVNIGCHDFCVGEILNWNELDSYARHHILCMGG